MVSRGYYVVNDIWARSSKLICQNRTIWRYLHDSLCCTPSFLPLCIRMSRQQRSKQAFHCSFVCWALSKIEIWVSNIFYIDLKFRILVQRKSNCLKSVKVISTQYSSVKNLIRTAHLSGKMKSNYVFVHYLHLTYFMEVASRNTFILQVSSDLKKISITIV